MNEFSRMELLLEDDSINKLKQAHIAVFGVGGVGGHCVESLVRAAIGEITIVDNDVVSLTNINRQIIALHSTVGQPKVTVMNERIQDINPYCKVHPIPLFIDYESIESIDFNQFDYIVDAIDTVSAKILLIEKAKSHQIPIISCMGTGNKFETEMLKIMDISETRICPLAKVMRRELKSRKINHLKVLSSYEIPRKPKISEEITNKRSVPGSVSFVPSAAGIIIAKEVIMDLLK